MDKYNIIYNVALMHESKTDTCFALFLSGLSDHISMMSSKKIRVWNRWFDAKTEDELFDQIMKYDKWNECKYSNGKIVSSEGMLNRFGEAEVLKDAFYSEIYIGGEITENESNEIKKILKSYNSSRCLYTRAEVTKIAIDIKPEFHVTFGFEKSKDLLPRLRHVLKTDSNYYHQMEVK